MVLLRITCSLLLCSYYSKMANFGQPKSHAPVAFGAGITAIGRVCRNLNFLATHQVLYSLHAHRVLEQEPRLFNPIVNQLACITVGAGRSTFGATSGFEIPLVSMRIASVKNHVHLGLLVAHCIHIIANWPLLVNQKKVVLLY